MVTKAADFSPVRGAGALITYAGVGLPKGNAAVVEVDRSDGPGTPSRFIAAAEVFSVFSIRKPVCTAFLNSAFAA